MAKLNPAKLNPKWGYTRIRGALSNLGHTRLVKILERPAGQQFAPFRGLLESGIAVGYVFLPGAQFVAWRMNK